MKEVIILLHGLGRRALAMRPLEKHLEEQGYWLENISYPSRQLSIEALADLAIRPAVEQHACAPALHFVSHSLGGILVRQFLATHKPKNLGRCVMLGPPNGGSELVDFLRQFRVYERINGPAGLQLGTDTQSVPQSLGPVDFELGVIAGNKPAIPIKSPFIVGEHDGKVSVERSKIDGMKEHIVLPVTHTFMMRNSAVINQVTQFLAHGSFSPQAE